MPDSSPNNQPRTEQKIVRLVLSLSDPKAREELLQQLCGGNEALEASVRKLLRNAQAEKEVPEPKAAQSVPATPPDHSGLATIEVSPSQLQAAPSDSSGSRQWFEGRYKFIDQMGEGGMGTVWRAQQMQPVKREVAIKLIRSGMDSKSVLARFDAERQALALMDHPNIARVLDGGTVTEVFSLATISTTGSGAEATVSSGQKPSLILPGQPYFVMELVRGLPLTEYCDQKRLTILQRLELFVQICSAVQHAHQKGIIHRDLKPTNILVTEIDGNPIPKVIDFGLAKALSSSTFLTEQTLHTGFGMMIGTPLYMAPEQLEANALDIDTRADIYALGVLLYEILTGSTPHDRKRMKEAAWEEVRRIIREEEPLKPSSRLSSIETLPNVAATRRCEPISLQRLMQGELDWIVMKTLDKDRNRRYETANGLAADVRNYLMGDLVAARPASTMYRIKKYALRHRKMAIAVSCIVLSLLAGFVGMAWLAHVANQAKVLADKQRTVALEETEKSTLLAIENKRLADEAQLTAAISDARYFIAKSDLPSAWRRLQHADQLGLTFKDRIVLDEFHDAARDEWRLVNYIPTTSRCCVFPDSSSCFLYCEGNRLIFCEEGGRETIINLPIEATSLIAMDSNKVLVQSEQDICLVQIKPSLSMVNRVQFESLILKCVSTTRSILIACADDIVRMLAGDTLTEIESWKWDNLPCTFPLDSKTKMFLSPDDRFLLLHSAPWQTPAVVIDRHENPHKINSLRSGLIRLGANGQLTFDRKSPNRCYGWFSPSAFGGLDDQVWSLTLGGKVTQPQLLSVASSTTKGQLDMRVNDHGVITLIGTSGMAFVNQDGREVQKSIRFDTLWPFDRRTPEFLAANIDGSQIAISINSGVAIFEPTISNSRSDFSNLNWSTAITTNGVLSLNGRDTPILSYTPFERKSDRWQVRPQWISSKDETWWYTWGCDLSRDQRTFIILAQATNGSDTVSSEYTEKRLLVYRLDNGLSPTADWKIYNQFELSELNSRHGFENRRVKLSASATAVFVHYGSHMYCYDCVTGKLKAPPFSAVWAVFSDDDSLLAVNHLDREIRIYRTDDTELVATIDFTSTQGGCFSNDNSQFCVSQHGRSIVCIDVASSSRVWEKPSRIIPRAWHRNEGCFVGLLPEDNGNGASLVLVDNINAQKISILSDVGSLDCKVKFSQDGNSLFFDQHRWNHRIVRFSPLEVVKNDMQFLSRSTGESFITHRNVLVQSEKKSNLGIQSSDLKSTEDIARAAGTIQEIRGRVLDVFLTRAGNAANVMVEVSENVAISIWISPPVFRQLPELPTKERLVIARGRVQPYGGRDPKLASTWQIDLSDPKQLTLIDQE
jgi:serine/threonine protein kinase